MFKNFFIGFIRVHILYHASKKPIYGLWMIEELAEHGYKLSPGTLYPILRRLESDGLLKSFRNIVAGKVRKYYALTKKGRRTLNELRIKINELVAEVMENNGGKKG